MDLCEKIVSCSSISDLINNLTDEDMDELGRTRNNFDDPDDYYCYMCSLVFGYAKELLISYIEDGWFDQDAHALFCLLKNM